MSTLQDVFCFIGFTLTMLFGLHGLSSAVAWVVGKLIKHYEMWDILWRFALDYNAKKREKAAMQGGVQ